MIDVVCRNSEVTGTSQVFENAVHSLERRIAGTQRTLDTLKHQLQCGRLSSREIGLLLVQEIEVRMREDVAVLQFLSGLAANVDALHARLQAYETQDTESNHKCVECLANNSQLKYVR